MALLASGCFDAGTLLAKIAYLPFETNPIFLITGNIILVIILKFVVLGILCFGLIRGTETDWLQYALVLTAVYGTIGQFYAGYSNLHVAMMETNLSQVLPKQEAMRSYLNMVYLYQLLPLVIATLSFKIYKWGGYDSKG
jgi:hypothetical protein